MASDLTPKFGDIVPSQKLQTLTSNYLNFTNGDNNNFAQQYLPEIYEQEVERYGNRTLSGFLRMVGAEMPMTSDQVVWSEQERLHIAYDGVAKAAGAAIVVLTWAGTAGANAVQNVIAVGDTVVIMDPTSGNEATAIVTASATGIGAAACTITVAPYLSTHLGNSALGAAKIEDLKIFVSGSEYKKGTTDATANSITPAFTQFSNSPIIIKSRYAISGSDTAQIGWVEVATEDGTGGYLWYLKAESETRLRFEDYLEMSVVEGELATAGLGAGSAVNAGFKGTQGLFSAIKERGNVQSEFGGTIAEFDVILKNLDTQGAIEENMLFVNRGLALELDDMLAGLSAGAQGGTAYGLFENSEDMALNLGFTGFRRGSYDFYKTDWKYLNDASTRGALAKANGDSGVNPIEGVLVPAGTSTVYDQVLGTNIRRPFLHVRYRASQADDRRMKSWLTGSVGGAYTSDLDAMEVHFLSERCLCVQAANNFVLFTK
jgi:hypothetical protein